MPFTSASKGLIDNLKRVYHSYSSTNADTGQQISTALGSVSVSGGNITSTASALSAISKGMGETDVIASVSYPSASNASNQLPGIAFWGTSSSGGTWWTAVPTGTSSSSSSTTGSCYTSTTTVPCGGSQVGPCLAGSSRLTCGTYGTATCSPSGKGATCSNSCSNYTSSCSSGANQTLTVSSPCGTTSFTSSAGGQWATRRCCWSYADGSTCNAGQATCSGSGCNPGGCCSSISYNTTTTTTYYTNIQIGYGTPSSQSSQITISRYTSNSSWQNVGGVKISTSGNGIIATLYSDTALTSPIGSDLSYSPSSPTRGDYVGVYFQNASSVSTFEAKS